MVSFLEGFFVIVVVRWWLVALKVFYGLGLLVPKGSYYSVMQQLKRIIIAYFTAKLNLIK